LNRRHQPHYAADGESLQADVMRFMAIIAFCLIAVLALVRNVEPPAPPIAAEQEPDSVPTPATPQMPETPVPEAPTPNPVPVARPKVVPKIAPVVAPPMVAAMVAEPQVKPESVAPIAPKSTPAPAPRAAQLPIVEVTAQAPTRTDAEETSEEEQGLSLRFASDRDFLRLVTKGEIQVFAYQARDEVREQARKVLGLDRNFEFLSTEAPGQIYELLPETIPNLIVAALDRATPESGSYTWGIRMPKELEGKIRGFIDRDVHGELVIDRCGDVHHVAS
jgi:hypothetical protein